jgi:hypothetical protein
MARCGLSPPRPSERMAHGPCLAGRHHRNRRPPHWHPRLPSRHRERTSSLRRSRPRFLYCRPSRPRQTATLARSSLRQAGPVRLLRPRLFWQRELARKSPRLTSSRRLQPRYLFRNLLRRRRVRRVRVRMRPPSSLLVRPRREMVATRATMSAVKAPKACLHRATRDHDRKAPKPSRRPPSQSPFLRLDRAWALSGPRSTPKLRSPW